NVEAADKLFEGALAQIKQTTLEESIRAICFSYAEVLKARGAYEQAMDYYRAAAQSYPRAVRVGIS
ncbi:MAG TPA: hypothetical protein VM409_01815, partial [Chloroflexia bacterium]|nr:hypothetical protein [Chloroflexia bacterium]